MTLTTRTITNAGAPLYATDGTILANATITFALVDHIGMRSDAWDAVTGERVGGDPILATTDASGEFTVALWPNSRGATATRYLCTVNRAGFRPFYGVVEDDAQPLPWVSFMASGAPLTPQEISQLKRYLDEIEAAKLEAEAARDAADAAAQAAIDLLGSKVDKIPGKGLSTEDYSTAEKNKLAGVATGATANSSDAALRDRSTHTGTQAISTVTGLQPALDAKEAAGAAAAAVSAHVALEDPHTQYTTPAEAAAAAPVQSVAGKTGAVTLAKADVGLSNVDNTSDAAKPVSTATQAALDGKAAAVHTHSVATTLADGFLSAADKTKLDSIAAGATAYTHPTNHPASIITQDANNRFVTDAEKATWNGKQDALTSGVSIKTVNGASLLGSGDVAVGGSTEIIAPTNTSPANGAASIQETPTLTGSTYYEMYGAAQTAIQVQVHTSADFTAPAYSSGDQPAGTSFTLPAGVLQTSQTYYWRMRYKSARGTYSDWSAPTSFATAAQFNSYIPAPAATPSNFGDALEGGFYAGMIWNELVQSATSTAIGTGSKTFTVPSMTGAPIVYEGQQLEVRSRANPANKMVGTVTGAFGTGLTLNVTSVGGSGTFADWSIMSRYRVIVAPKASGENAGIELKNADTAFPVACQTLTEGLRATQAMRDANTSTVYPAAHWARSLNIGGRTDWYIPARDELELCWRNLKPVTDNNYTTADRPTGATPNYANSGSYGDTANTHGRNNNSAPVGAAYTSGAPAQTAAAAFRTGGAEAFEYGSAYYRSSSEYSASLAWGQDWNSSSAGYQDAYNKTNAHRVRAVRRSII